MRCWCVYREVMWKDRPPDFPHDFTVHAPASRPLNQLSKNHSRPNALASTLFLLFGTRCRSDARGHGLFEARLPRARPLEVRRAVGLDRSFVRLLWRPLSAGATRPAANNIICHLASSLSRGCPSTARSNRLYYDRRPTPPQSHPNLIQSIAFHIP